MSTQNERVGRNAPCPCGSGKKFKKCCLGREKVDSDHDFSIKLPPSLQFLSYCTDSVSRELLFEYRMDPICVHDADFWNDVGHAASINCKSAAAVTCYEKAIKLDPKNYTAMANIAVDLAQVGEIDKAFRFLAKVPDRSNRKEVISANILQDLGRHEEAIKNYELAIEDEPDFFLPYARILNSLRKVNSRIIEFWLEKGRRAIPESVEIGHAYCFHLFSEARFDELADADWIDDLKSDAGRVDMVGMNSEDPELILECKLFRRIAQIQLNDNRGVIF